MRVMRDALRATFGRAAPRRGTLERIAGFESKILSNIRDVTVYLPPGYQEGEQRYPVLYMQDGQNLLEPQRAFIPGQHWRLDEAADQAIADRTMRPLIIVAVDHAGPGRIDEYTPTRDDALRAGGKAADYGRMLIEELKPAIDSCYRTDPAGSGIGGSSLGGLASLYVGLTHPDRFRRLAVMSPSLWWDRRSIFGVVDRFSGERPRTWLDVGGREGQDTVRDARALRDRLMDKGWSGSDLRYHEDRRGGHSEHSWARRVRPMLEFLFPAES